MASQGQLAFGVPSDSESAPGTPPPVEPLEAATPARRVESRLFICQHVAEHFVLQCYIYVVRPALSTKKVGRPRGQLGMIQWLCKYYKAQQHKAKIEHDEEQRAHDGKLEGVQKGRQSILEKRTEIATAPCDFRSQMAVDQHLVQPVGPLGSVLCKALATETTAARDSRQRLKARRQHTNLLLQLCCGNLPVTSQVGTAETILLPRRFNHGYHTRDAEHRLCLAGTVWQSSVILWVSSLLGAGQNRKQGVARYVFVGIHRVRRSRYEIQS